MKRFWEYIKQTLAVLGLIIAVVITIGIYLTLVEQPGKNLDDALQNTDEATSTFIEVDTDKFSN